jgi:hypothetical protein
MTCLPISAARARTAASVSSVVAEPRISSISGITGTGLKKCIPTNRARRSSPTDDANRSIAIEEVFVAKIAEAGASPSSADQSAVFASTSSKIASTTSPTSVAPATRSSVALMRPRIASRSASLRRPFPTDRSRLPAIRSRPA